MGKTKDDLPVIAIDSFRHMYVFPNYDEAAIPGKMKKFIEDLYSGKLHREYHFGPDDIDISEKDDSESVIATTESTIATVEQPETGDIDVDTIELAAGSSESSKEKRKVPDSAFKKLAPSKNRYTMRNEL